jgi:hypothetical protein
MERVMKCIKALFISAILVIALTTCSNPFDFVAAVTDEVMVAKDMYLEVTEVTPVKNTAAFNPEAPILIEFDRAIDLASVTPSSVVISPEENWPEPTFDTGTNTLKIMPYSLEGDAPYTITINSGVKGIDGSVVRTPYVWNFTTDNLPTGGLVIKDRFTLSATYKTTYTNERYVDLAIEANGVVNEMRYSQTSFLKDNGTLAWKPVDDLVEDYELELGSDGERTVYIQFRKYSISPPIDLRTEVKSDSIILDTTAPVVTTFGTVPSDLGNSGWTSNAVINETGSGIASYAWTKPSGTGTVTFTPDNTLNTFISPTVEGTLYVRLRVYDEAENTGYLTTGLINIDMTPPSAPIVTGPANPTTDITPNFTWTAGEGGPYNYRLTSGSWTETTSTSASPSINDRYGTNTLYVQQRDAAGNWSSSGSASTFVYPFFLEPAHGATGVSLMPTLQWAEGVNSRYTYDVYFGYNGKLEKLELRFPTQITYTFETKLATGRVYQWFYIRYYRGELDSYYPYGAIKEEYFTFRAGS